MTAIVIFINFVFIVIWVKLKNKILQSENNNDDNDDVDDDQLTVKRMQNNIYPVDCNVTLTKCSSNKDCQDLCLNINNYCESESGLCTHNGDKDFCLNNGRLIEYCLYDQWIKICSCTDEYFGPRCQWKNPFKRLDQSILKIPE